MNKRRFKCPSFGQKFAKYELLVNNVTDNDCAKCANFFCNFWALVGNENFLDGGTGAGFHGKDKGLIWGAPPPILDNPTNISHDNRKPIIRGV